MRAVIFTLGILLGFTTAGHAFNTIWCGEPNGMRYDYNPSGEMVLNEDGFSGVQLLFKVDPQESRRLFVYWGDSSAVLQSPLSELYKTGEEPIVAAIVKHDATTLTAIAKDNDESMWMYTFFRDRKIGFYSRHKPADILHPPVATIMMFSTCRFARE